MKKQLQNFVLLFMILFFASCSSRNLVYFSNLPQQSRYTTTILNQAQPKIQSGDILSIRVNSLSEESNVIFNGSSVNANSSNNPNPSDGYLVDQNGMINFPIVGKIKLEGITMAEARERMTKEVSKYVKDPVVNVRLVNFKVTVIGEVQHPSSFTVQNERINLLEALGMAGDMTAYGKRENVLVIRQNGNERTMARVNLNDKNVLNSPYFNLHQNDVVYVEPVKAKAAQANNSNRFIPIIVGLTSIISIIASRLYYAN